jgi:putative ABC transport system permease protein
MFQDIRFGLRRVFGSAAFSLSVIIIIAAGVGVAGAMASVLNALAFRSVAFPNASGLVAVSTLDKDGRSRTTPLPAIERLRAADLSATGWCAYNSTIDAISASGRVLDASGELLAGDCLSVTGIAPAMGRWFTEDEAPFRGTGRPVIVITDRLWQRLFDRRADILGQPVTIEAITATVIGVMPPAYRGFSQDLSTDFIIPFNAHRAASGGFMYLGRLKPGATVEQLGAEIRTLWPALLESVLPASATRAQVLAESSGGVESASGGFSTLRRLYTSPVRRLTILAAVLMLLVCVNVGGLLVSRIAARSPEIAAMRALGATPLRIARPLAAECVIYAVAGSLLGIPLAYAGAAAFGTLLPIGNMAWTMDTTPDPAVIAGVAAASLVVALLIAALPIALAIRRGPQMRSDRSVSRATSRWAQGLLVSQVAVTVVLVFSCGLVLRSFNSLRTANLGFDGSQFLSLRLSSNPGGYVGMNAATYYQDLLARVAALPGVESVGLARYFGTINATLPEQPVSFAERDDAPTTGATEFISPGFFATARVPLLSGRDVSWSDVPQNPRVAVVSESLARALAPDGDVIGRVIRHGTSPATAKLQIVGVVANLSMGNYRRTDLRMIYLSSVQTGDTTFATVHVRTAGPPLQLAQAVSTAIASLGREHVRGVYTDVLFSNSIVAERMGSMVSGAVALLALTISGIGLFALMAHTVERRTREIGIRLAIGATPAIVARLVLRQALVLIAAGVVLGVPVAIGAASVVQSLLYEVSTTDRLTLALSALVLLGTGALATALPAARAVRVDPATALRAE